MEAQTTLQATDNITEVLTMVLDFTSQRHKILIENLNNINNKDYIPRDLDVNQFASAIDSAITEHVINGRLALSDSDNIRFETNLQININVSEKKHNFLLPPLSIQILIENAVKHNSPSEENQLIININITNIYLQVTNNILRAPTEVDSFKIGLNNIKKRYKFHTKKEVIIERTKEFSVKLPLIKNNLSNS